MPPRNRDLDQHAEDRMPQRGRPDVRGNPDDHEAVEHARQRDHRSVEVEPERTADPRGSADDHEDIELAREQRVSRFESPEADEEELAEDDILEELDDDEDDLARMDGDGPDA